MLRFLTAGESHGSALLAILEGMPAGLKVAKEKINQELRLRQSGYGRGKRMSIEKDKAQILCGLKNSVTLGSPIGILIKNKDFSIQKLPAVFSARPGHADLAGALKYGFKDLSQVLERASARETATRVAVGAICKIFLNQFKVRIKSRVLMIGAEDNQGAMRAKVNQARKAKDTLGGIFQVTAFGVIAGLGSYAHWDRRLDARLAQAIISIPGIKAVEFGLGFDYAKKFGSEVHDAIYFSQTKGFYRKSNNAGGIEGGVSNGQPIILRACMKPISTLLNPLDSVNIRTKKAAKAAVQRSDICVVEAAAVIAESVCAFVLVDTFLEKFGSDNLKDITQTFQEYQRRLK